MDKISTVGGFLALLVFIHFFVDWIFQSHDEAMVKHNNWKVRAKHCFIYTIPFIPFMHFCGLSWFHVAVGAKILFWSHFIEDTYIPVFLWAKYIRRPPELQWRLNQVKGRLFMLGPKIFIGPFPHTRDIAIDEKPNWRDEVFRLCGELRGSNSNALKNAQDELDHRGFTEFIDTTMGKILMIAIDQIIHIAFLIPIAVMLTYK